VTGREFISASMRLLGVLASGETPSANETADGLGALNRMLSSWSTESLLINARVREVFPLISGQSAYTMGPSGNFNTTRPLNIDNALIRLAGTSPQVETPLLILNLDQWSGITLKDLDSNIPIYLYAEGTSPLETLNIWPVPSATHELVLYSWKALTSFASANTDVSFPPGYEEALIYNLAVRLAPEFGKTVTAEVATIANDSKANIKRMNERPLYLQVDAALMPHGRPFNWLTGE